MLQVQPATATANNASRFRLAWLILLLPLLAASLKAWLHPAVGSDGLRYLFPIHHWLAGQGWTYLGEAEHLYPPGYGLTAWLFYQLYPDIEFSGIAVAVVSYGLIGPLLYAWLAPVLGRVGAFLPLLFIYNQPNLFGYATTTMTECPYILVSLGLYAAALAWWQEPRSLVKAGVTGLLAGYGYLLRPEMMGIGGALLGLFLVRGSWLAWRQKSPPTLGPALLALLLFAGCLASYGLMQKSMTGRFALTGKGVSSMQIMENRERREALYPTTAASDQTLLGYFLAKDQDWVLQRWRANFWRERQILQQALWPALLLLLLAGLARIHSKNAPPLPSPLPWLLLGSCFAVPLLVYPFFMVNDRYLLPVVSVLWLMAGVWIVHGLRDSVILPILLLVALLMMGSRWQSGFMQVPEHGSLRQAGIWLSQHGQDIPLETIATPRKRQLLAFYALDKKQVTRDVPFQARFFQGSRRQLLEHYRQLGYRHLLLDGLYTFDNLHLAQLWEDPASGLTDGARLIHQDDSFKVFRLEEAP